MQLHTEAATMRTKIQTGFSLIELAVALFIIGLLASMGIASFKAQMVNASIKATKGNQDTIKDALVTYLGKNRRLPCPDTDLDGIENRTLQISTVPLVPDTTSPCVKSFGLIPYQTLGLSKSVTIDGWDNFFAYQVSNTTPISTALNQDWSITTNFHEGNTGSITIQDRSPSLITASSNAVVVIISYGKDGLGSYTIKGTQNALPDPTAQPDEYQNTAPNPPTVTFPANVFFKREYSDSLKDLVNNPGGPFDDVVMVLSANDLLTPLIKDGVMQSALSAYIAQTASIQDWVAATITPGPYSAGPPASGCQIPTTPLSIVDPWGNTLSTSAGAIFKYAPPTSTKYSSISSTQVYTLSNSTMLNGTQVLPPIYQTLTPTQIRFTSTYPALGDTTNFKCP
jgi:prepilin-type N-terminal cleavage/methylation domain-containing protein